MRVTPKIKDKPAATKNKEEGILEPRLASLLLGEMTIIRLNLSWELLLVGTLLRADVLESGQGLDALYAKAERNLLLKIRSDKALDHDGVLSVHLGQDAFLKKTLQTVPDHERSNLIAGQ